MEFEVRSHLLILLLALVQFSTFSDLRMDKGEPERFARALNEAPAWRGIVLA